jgi:hypothetical protein
MGSIADASGRDFLRLENLDVDIPPDPEAVERTRLAAVTDSDNSYLPFAGQSRLREAAARHVQLMSGVHYSGAGEIRPNMVVGCDADLGSDRKPERWFNTNCFTAPGAYGFGNVPRMFGGVRADGVNHVDFSIGKAFKICGRG